MRRVLLFLVLLVLGSCLHSCSQAEPPHAAQAHDSYPADSIALMEAWSGRLRDAATQGQLADVWMQALGHLDTASVLAIGIGAEGASRLLAAGTDSVAVWAPDSVVQRQLMAHTWPASQQARITLASTTWDSLPQPWLRPQGRHVILLQEALHRMPRRVPILRALLPALAPGAALVIVEARPGTQQPTLAHPLPAHDILTDLRHAGYRHFTLDSTRLSTHYLITAR